MILLRIIASISLDYLIVGSYLRILSERKALASLRYDVPAEKRKKTPLHTQERALAPKLPRSDWSIERSVCRAKYEAQSIPKQNTETKC